MNNFQIETAQNVHLSQSIANLGDRSLAYLIDILILLAYELIMFGIFNILGLKGFNIWVLISVFGLPLFLYHLLMETFNNGQSLGKAALKIRVVKIDGSRPAFSNYLIRWLLRIVDFSISSGAVAIVTFLLNGKGQRLGDLAASTTVISEKQRMTVKETIMVDVPQDYIPNFPQVTVFTDQDMEKIKNIFQNARRKQKREVIETLAHKVASIMEIQTQEESSILFLKRVITDYNYYTQQ